MPNSRYIRCTNPHQGDRIYFYRFPLHGQPPAPLASSVAPTPTPSSTPSTSARPTCSVPGCASTRLDTGCPRLMCRRHCNKAGPCALRAHEWEHVRKSQTTVPAAAPAPAPAPAAPPAAPPALPATSGARRRRSMASTLPFTDYDSLDDWIAQTLPPILALEAHQHETSFLDDLPGVKSPTPETETVRERYEREEWEDAAQLALGLRLSQEQENAGAGPSQRAGPSQPLRLPTSILQAGRHRSFSPPASLPSPRPLSPSPDFPVGLLPLVSHKAKARATKTAAPLRITTQLNPDWMSTSPSPNTFHVKKKAPASARSFMVVYWARPNTMHRTFVIEDVPAWPRCRISEATRRFAAHLGDDLDIELYYPKYKSWAEISLTFIHTVTPDSVVMLRRTGVDCLDLDATIQRFYPNTDIVHMRKNLPGERAALRRLYKQSRGTYTDDSDVEVVLEKKRIKTEDDAGDALRRQRRCLHVDVDDVDDDDVVVIIDDNNNDNASTPTLTTASSTLSSSAPSPALSSSSLPMTTTIRWPAGLHVVDMVAGFQKMDSRELAAYDRKERFKRAFNGYLYRTSTVTEQRAIYRSATRAEIKKGVDAGYTKDGLWSVWRKQLAANATGI